MARHRIRGSCGAAGFAVLVLAASAARAADGAAPAAGGAPGAPAPAPTAAPAAPKVPAAPTVPAPTAAPMATPMATTAPLPGTPAWTAPALPPPPPAERSDLREAVEKALGAPVHGRLSMTFESRFFDGGHESDATTNDFDLYTHLDVRVGDELKDRLSAAAYVRANLDLGTTNESGGEDNRYLGLSDTYDSSLNAQLYTAYVNWRPADGPVEVGRFGRQYVYVADTFQVDGVSVTSRPMAKDLNLRVQAYGGVPVHLYEADGSGDWLAGVRATADPFKGTRAAVDYAHVEDEASGYSTQKNDLAALSLWQAIGDQVDLHGRFTWLDGPRDALLRATVNFPEQDFLVQASYKRLLDDQEHLATEFDPYYAILQTLYEYQQGEIRAVKGFGEMFSLEAGASARRMIDDGDEGVYNRDTTRYWLAPSFEDLIVDGSTLTLSGEKWDGGDDDGTATALLDFTYRASRDTDLSIGTDYSRWDYGRVRDGERSNVKTAYARVQARIGDGWTIDLRYAWERDDEETDHVFTLGLSVEF